jgi:hypothetical protein
LRQLIKTFAARVLFGRMCQMVVGGGVTFYLHLFEKYFDHMKLFVELKC